MQEPIAPAQIVEARTKINSLDYVVYRTNNCLAKHSIMKTEENQRKYQACTT